MEREISALDKPRLLPRVSSGKHYHETYPFGFSESATNIPRAVEIDRIGGDRVPLVPSAERRDYCSLVAPPTRLPETVNSHRARYKVSRGLNERQRVSEVSEDRSLHNKPSVPSA